MLSGFGYRRRRRRRRSQPGLSLRQLTLITLIPFSVLKVSLFQPPGLPGSHFFAQLHKQTFTCLYWEPVAFVDEDSFWVHGMWWVEVPTQCFQDFVHYLPLFSSISNIQHCLHQCWTICWCFGQYRTMFWTLSNNVLNIVVEVLEPMFPTPPPIGSAPPSPLPSQPTSLPSKLKSQPAK